MTEDSIVVEVAPTVNTSNTAEAKSTALDEFEDVLEAMRQDVRDHNAKVSAVLATRRFGLPQPTITDFDEEITLANQVVPRPGVGQRLWRLITCLWR